MAESKFTTPGNTTIAGGNACMEALRKLEAAIPSDDSTTAEDYFNRRAALFADCVSHAGELSPRAAGFMETLVEYAFLNMEAGEPDLDHWKSEASMCEVDLTTSRQKLANIWNGNAKSTEEVDHV